MHALVGLAGVVGVHGLSMGVESGEYVRAR
jgi:hypothetical protein